MEQDNKGRRDFSGTKSSSELLRTKIQDEFLKGRMIAERYHLPESVGIEYEEDYSLFSQYLTHRLFRTNIYNTSYFLNHPAAPAIARLSRVTLALFNNVDKLDRSRRAMLTLLEDTTKGFVDRNYHTPFDREYARDIELCVHDLFVNSSVEKGSSFKLQFKPAVVEEWAGRWDFSDEVTTQTISEGTPLILGQIG